MSGDIVEMAGVPDLRVDCTAWQYRPERGNDHTTHWCEREQGHGGAHVCGFCGEWWGVL